MAYAHARGHSPAAPRCRALTRRHPSAAAARSRCPSARCTSPPAPSPGKKALLLCWSTRPKVWSACWPQVSPWAILSLRTEGAFRAAQPVGVGPAAALRTDIVPNRCISDRSSQCFDSNIARRGTAGGCSAFKSRWALLSCRCSFMVLLLNSRAWPTSAHAK